MLTALRTRLADIASALLRGSELMVPLAASPGRPRRVSCPADTLADSMIAAHAHARAVDAVDASTPSVAASSMPMPHHQRSCSSRLCGASLTLLQTRPRHHQPRPTIRSGATLVRRRLLLIETDLKTHARPQHRRSRLSTSSSGRSLRHAASTRSDSGRALRRRCRSRHQVRFSSVLLRR